MIQMLLRQASLTARFRDRILGWLGDEPQLIVMSRTCQGNFLFELYHSSLRSIIHSQLHITNEMYTSVVDG